VTQSVIQTSFAGGELSPTLYARVDLEKFHVGAALIRNFYVDYTGGITTRAGTQFLARTRLQNSKAVRLIPFIVSNLAAYVLEFGDQYVRFYSNGAQVTEATKNITGITQANPGVVTSNAHGYANGDEVFISGVGGMTSLNGKNYLIAGATANTYTLTTLDGVPINTATLPAYTAGGTSARILTLLTPYLAEDLALLKFVQSADVLTLTHPNYQVRNLARTSPSSFTLQAITIGPSLPAPSGTAAVPTTAGNLGFSYVVTAVAANGEESLPSPLGVCASVALDSAAPKVVTVNWAYSGNAAYFNIYKNGPTPAASPPGSVHGLIGQSKSATFVDANFAPDFTKVPPEFNDPFSPGQVISVSVTNGGSGFISNAVTFNIAGDGIDASGYPIVDTVAGKIIGIVITNGGHGYTFATASVAGGGGSGATFVVNIGGAGTYPSCATYYQQRRVYGAPQGKPETLTMSQPGNYNNFDTTPVSLDTDAITISIASREVNFIKSMVPSAAGLIVFTSGGASLITGGGQQSALTPSSVSAAPQASTGANDMPPIVVNYDILFVQAKGPVVRDLKFDYYNQSFLGTDRTTLASHLFFNKGLVEWAYAQEPLKLVWVVRNDGALLSLTYVPEQEVYAWARHDTNGLFTSICSIPEGAENAVYVVVQRWVGGTWRKYVERFSSKVFDTAADAWCVDSGLRYPLVTQNTVLTPGAISGVAVPFTASGATFAPGDVGKVIWGPNGAKATITSYTSATQVVASIESPFPALFDSPNADPIMVGAGSWSMTAPTTKVFGLDHLIGKTVAIVADGRVLPNQVVAADGSVTLDTPATKIFVGLSFVAQFQSLYLDVGEPTTQGKMKFVQALTLRVDRTRGLKAGPDFNSLLEIKSMQVPFAPPNELYSGDLRINLLTKWTEGGQVAVQQDYPVPATILGLIPDFVGGDNGR
jgi:hypothetical protein